MNRAKERLLANIETITSLEELQAFWSALNEEQPDMARDADIQRAKDARNLAIRRDRIQSAEQESWRK